MLRERGERAEHREGERAAAAAKGLLSPLFVNRRHDVYEAGEDMARFYASKIFTDNWFGMMGNDPNENYAVTSGWAAAISLDPAAWHMAPGSARVTNAYGLMRSPWNAANDVRLLRSNATFGYYTAYTSAPRCSEFYKAMNVTDVVEFTKYAQANAHGAIHTLIGGVSNADWKTLFEDVWGLDSDLAESLGLQGFGVIKDLWRAGVVTCPSDCAMEDALSSCSCTCPDYDSWDEKDAFSILNKHSSNIPGLTFTAVMGTFEGQRMAKKFMSLVCGKMENYESPFHGDAMNSGATADPTFWPVHPNVDRLFQWRRLEGMTGTETWPHGDLHGHEFYWGGGGEFSVKSCWGHQPANHMIWKDLGFVNDPFATGYYYTVKDLWQLNDPDAGHLPYTYPFFRWDACAAEGYPSDLKWAGTVTDDDAPLVNTRSTAEALTVSPPSLSEASSGFSILVTDPQYPQPSSVTSGAYAWDAVFAPHREHDLEFVGPSLKGRPTITWTLSKKTTSDAGGTSFETVRSWEGEAVEPNTVLATVAGCEHRLDAVDESGNSASTTFMSKHVRREIRSLSDADREGFLSAVASVYSTPTKAGQERYGEDFLGGEW